MKLSARWSKTLLLSASSQDYTAYGSSHPQMEAHKVPETEQEERNKLQHGKLLLDKEKFIASVVKRQRHHSQWGGRGESGISIPRDAQNSPGQWLNNLSSRVCCERGVG